MVNMTLLQKSLKQKTYVKQVNQNQKMATAKGMKKKIDCLKIIIH
jgi:hypothetical protein